MNTFTKLVTESHAKNEKCQEAKTAEILSPMQAEI